MTVDVCYNIKLSCNGYENILDNSELVDTVYRTYDVTKLDALKYLYEKEFHKTYNSMNWYLEPGAKEFVKQFEDNWLHNRVDLYSLNRYELSDFIKSEHKHDVEHECFMEYFEEVRERLLAVFESKLYNLDINCEVID